MKICQGEIPKKTLALPVVCLALMARWVQNSAINPGGTYCCWQRGWTWNEGRPWHSWVASVPSRRWPGVPQCSHSLAAASPESQSAETANKQDTRKLHDKPCLPPTFMANPPGSSWSSGPASPYWGLSSAKIARVFSSLGSQNPVWLQTIINSTARSKHVCCFF